MKANELELIKYGIDVAGELTKTIN